MDKHPVSYYAINSITLYRLLSAPFLLFLAIRGNLDWFRLFLALSFFTDAIDGVLSRMFKVSSLFGTKLDSIADDATVLSATASLWIFRPDFMAEHWVAFAAVFTLFIIQNIVALIAYKRVTSFHTYLAKTAAVCQGMFFMMVFFDVGPVALGFYTAVIVTTVELIEEVILVLVLPEWKANVKGLFWVLKKPVITRESP
jgi:phosphatidylglycerophosphate synthase